MSGFRLLHFILCLICSCSIRIVKEILSNVLPNAGSATLFSGMDWFLCSPRMICSPSLLTCASVPSLRVIWTLEIRNTILLNNKTHDFKLVQNKLVIKTGEEYRMLLSVKIIFVIYLVCLLVPLGREKFRF